LQGIAKALDLTDSHEMQDILTEAMFRLTANMFFYGVPHHLDIYCLSLDDNW